LTAPSVAVWAADIDTDGDLDLVVATRDGHPTVLRNNGDGTFTPQDLFASVSLARGFVWADLDGEGVPDAAFVGQSGDVHVFANQRGGRFREETIPRAPGLAVAIAAIDDPSASVFDLLVLSADGSIARLSRDPRQRTWTVTPVLRTSPPDGFGPA